MREVCITIEAPPDVSVRVVRKEAPSRLRVSPRSKVGKPIRAFTDAFTAASTDDGATAPAADVRDRFEANYQTSGQNRREATKRAWQRALSLVEDAFDLERRSGVEIFKRLDEPTTGARREG